MICCSGAPNSPSAATRLSTAAAPNSSRRSLSPRSCSSWVSIVSSLSGFCLRPFEAGDHLDEAANVRVELGQILSRDPILLVGSAAGILDRVARQETARDREARHVPRAGGRYVPVARDLAGILLGQNRIENRLLGQPRREFAKPGSLDQLELLRADRAKQDNGVIHG